MRKGLFFCLDGFSMLLFGYFALQVSCCSLNDINPQSFTQQIIRAFDYDWLVGKVASNPRTLNLAFLVNEHFSGPADPLQVSFSRKPLHQFRSDGASAFGFFLIHQALFYFGSYGFGAGKKLGNINYIRLNFL